MIQKLLHSCTLLTRKRPPLGSYSRPMLRTLWWSQGVGVPDEQGTHIQGHAPTAVTFQEVPTGPGRLRSGQSSYWSFVNQSERTHPNIASCSCKGS